MSQGFVNRVKGWRFRVSGGGPVIRKIFVKFESYTTLTFYTREYATYVFCNHTFYHAGDGTAHAPVTKLA